MVSPVVGSTVRAGRGVVSADGGAGVPRDVVPVVSATGAGVTPSVAEVGAGVSASSGAGGWSDASSALRQTQPGTRKSKEGVNHGSIILCTKRSRVP